MNTQMAQSTFKFTYEVFHIKSNGKITSQTTEFCSTRITKVYAIVKGLSGRPRHAQTVQKLKIHTV